MQNFAFMPFFVEPMPQKAVKRGMKIKQSLPFAAFIAFSLLSFNA
ncbi:MAG: hypothetical protein RL157_1261, partial [Bacteroidota bacterium]